MKTLVIYIHGKGGNAEEAMHYRSVLAGCDVIGIPYQAQTPWDAIHEFSSFYDLYSKGYDSVVLIANSIGAYFAMHALAQKKIAKALFISPIVNMEKLITDRMKWENVTEDALQMKIEIPTALGESLSWNYLCYVRKHPIYWNVPTCILYGDQDALTSIETMSAFAGQIHATLTVMEGGEHWFHTDEQMRFLDEWVQSSIPKQWEPSGADGS